MTATPVKLLLKNKNSSFNNDETVYSMDNDIIYGKIIYEFSFYEGMYGENPILVPFKTIHFQ
jgi:predicted helicase